ncbi:Alpha/beta hydrolase fold-1 [Kalmanozyma brasiliensis GHG001]|uniref:Epoxide hydrolase N-terminal domain-containing protein n=1 Tax=Kalmanozyma brasiliensis (strain GHG001) TaxID=1365824 RepID=V5F1A0_KALBG|nr:Alpha/beta hydrolase fold-1 [Kalmanozyma brasiliensis GHG001]EST09049.1 Alpha/beta hydrolase fold-1 [Kalmanozyma brasiliensis GHG001]
MPQSIAFQDAVDVLLLGSGWTASFLIPLLQKNNLRYAYTSRSPPDEKDPVDEHRLQFELTDPVTKESLDPLPRAATVVIIFPIKNLEQVDDLVHEYEDLHGRTRWIQLGSTGIWGPGRSTSSSPYDTENARAAAEQRLLDVTSGNAAVLNLAGLYGGQRQPRNFASRVGASKELLSLKGSVHFVHGQDVARAILLLHKSHSAGWGRRWIISDTKVYDWWQLFRFLRPAIPEHPDDSPETAQRWVSELVEENHIRSLPRPIASKAGQNLPHYLERALEGHEFWNLFNEKPLIGSVYRGGEHGMKPSAIRANGSANGSAAAPPQSEKILYSPRDQRNDKLVGSSTQSFVIREFDPTIPQDRIDDLIERIENDAQRPLPSSAQFEGDHERFGLTHDRFCTLRDAWVPFLRGDTSSSASEDDGQSISSGRSSTRNRLGPDHDTWAAEQARMSAFDHYKVLIEDVDLHFIHERANPPVTGFNVKVIPLLLLHGWPGSFHEFLELVKPLAHPGNLTPIHFDVVVPSHPGYIFSSAAEGLARDSRTGKLVGTHSGPDGDLLVKDVARIMHKLMLTLGYRNYAVQAGDWGSAVLRSMANQFPNNVRAVHLNFCPSQGPNVVLPVVGREGTPHWVLRLPHRISKQRYTKKALGVFESYTHGERSRSFCGAGALVGSAAASATEFAWRSLSTLTLGSIPPPLTQEERDSLHRGIEFAATGSAYAAMHGTRPSTLGLVLSRSPLATLAWVGEKMHAWTDDDLPPSTVLANLTLYETTDTIGGSFYPYRNRDPRGPAEMASDPANYVKQPTAYSSFPMEIIQAPESFVRASVNLRWFRKHDEGGHFAALEQPVTLVEDLQDAFAQIWPC